LFFVVCLLVLLSSVLPRDCDGQTVNRCLKYRALVIRETRYHIGMGAPWHLFLGQIEQESRCDESATAFDGGQGLGQFMPATADWIHQQEPALKKIWRKPLPYDPRWNVRAMILYDKRLYETGTCPGWYFAFRAYNGGAGNLNKEITRAGSCSIALVEEQCARKKITLKNGHVLDLCTVNCEYPRLIFTKGEKYK